MNHDNGSVVLFSPSESDNSYTLSIGRLDDAANIAVFASQWQGGFPHLSRASVEARLLSGSGGVTALVMTNGYGNAGVMLDNN